MTGMLTIVVSLGLLGATIAVAVWSWNEIGDVAISWQGTMAMLIGVSATFLLGAGLMTLVFFSNRCGYDERSHDAVETASPEGSSAKQQRVDAR